MRLGIIAHVCSPSTERQRQEGHPWLHRETEASLAYMRPCHKNKIIYMTCNFLFSVMFLRCVDFLKFIVHVCSHVPS